MAHVISVQNVKGGCGKTTTAIHLAAALTDLGYAVALADGDPQKSALGWLERRPITSSLMGALPCAVRH